eukprot:6026243-Amphidinium_carterae.2
MMRVRPSQLLLALRRPCDKAARTYFIWKPLFLGAAHSADSKTFCPNPQPRIKSAVYNLCARRVLFSVSLTCFAQQSS